jgi:hypothetical protein
LIAYRGTSDRLEDLKHAARTLATYLTPIFGKLPVQAIDTGLVMKALEPIWSKKLETATRVRSRIEAILDWAKVRGDRDGENAARRRGHLENSLPGRSKVKAVKDHAAMAYRDIAAFVAELREREGIAARA